MADDPSDGDKDRNAPTVRELNGPTSSGDTVPDLIGLYVPPRPLPEASQHRTLDLKSVRISDQADPRRALTERRLVSPPRRVPSRSAWWMAAGAVVLLGALAWFVLSAPTPPASLAPPREPAPPLPTQASAARAESACDCTVDFAVAAGGRPRRRRYPARASRHLPHLRRRRLARANRRRSARIHGSSRCLVRAASVLSRAALAALFPLLLAEPARAEPTSAELATARRLFQEATALERQSAWREASKKLDACTRHQGDARTSLSSCPLCGAARRARACGAALCPLRRADSRRSDGSRRGRAPHRGSSSSARPRSATDARISERRCRRNARNRRNASERPARNSRASRPRPASHYRAGPGTA